MRIRLYFLKVYSPASVQLYITNGIEAGRWHNKSHGTFSGHAHQAYLQIANPDVLNDLVSRVVFASSNIPAHDMQG